MLYGEINRQRLKIIIEHVVADTIDYLEAQFAFSEDWDGLEKWVHFAKDGAVYDIRLTDDCVRKEDHLNLSAGIWKVYLHGNEFSGGKVIERITTNAAILKVEPTGTLDGEPFPEMPASVTEQILARLENVEQNGGGSGGGITKETDPTVPDWAKQPDPPKYTAADVGAATAQQVADLSKEKADKKNAVYILQAGETLDDVPEEYSVAMNPNEDGVEFPEGGDVQIDETLTQSGMAADAAVVGQKFAEQSEAIADNKSNIEKLIEANSEVIIKGDEYDWAAGYFDANGHFNGAYYYRIAIKQWFEVEPGETYRFQSNSTDKLLIRGYKGATGYAFVETLVTLEADKTITIPESINHITITLSRSEDNGDSIAVVNQMLAEAAEGLINPTVTKLFTLNSPDFTDCVRTVNGIEPDENGNVEINIPETGGGAAVKKIGTYTVSEDVNTVIIDADENGNPFGCDVLYVDILFKSTAQNTQEANVTFQPMINGVYTDLSVSMRYSARISGTIHRTVTAWLTQPTEPSDDAGGIGVQIVHDTAVPTRVGYSATKHNKIDGIKLYCGTQYIAAGSIIVISGR